MDAVLRTRTPLDIILGWCRSHFGNLAKVRVTFGTLMNRTSEKVSENSSDLEVSRAADIRNMFYYFLTPNILRATKGFKRVQAIPDFSSMISQ